MSHNSWDGNTSAEQERIINRKKKLQEKREERAEENPVAFGWETTDDGKYRCDGGECDCGNEYETLAGCLRHIAKETREEGQSSLGEWC